MKFKKIYIEITNSCNFACTFCFKSNRRKTFISPEIFSAILFSIRPYTDYIYLHVLGEPLLHPQLDELLNEAERQGFHINLTTNGSLLEVKSPILKSHHIRQYNISLHDAEENIPRDKWKEHWMRITDFVKNNYESSYFSLRLWNEGSESSVAYNEQCVRFLEETFHQTIGKGRNVQLMEHVYLQRSGRFSWPGEKQIGNEQKTCYALRDHIAILVDGTVVPCCLDADASMALGNILRQPLAEILETERAQNIRKGFQEKRIIEPICRDCGFVLP